MKIMMKFGYVQTGVKDMKHAPIIAKIGKCRICGNEIQMGLPIDMLTCFMSLSRPPPKNFYPGVNLDFAGRPLPPPRQRDLEKFRALALL